MFKIFIVWFVNVAVKAMLLIALIMLVAKVKAEDAPNTAVWEQTSAFHKSVNEMNALAFEIHSSHFMSNRDSYRKNKKFAPAYRLRETPHFAVKSNLLFDITSSMNIGAEVRLGQKMTLDLPFTYNPWTYNREENSKFKFFLFQPELRYWTCEAFDGHFFGLHAHYGYFNVGRMPVKPFGDAMNQYRYEGQLAGVGISYGYVWPMSPRWSLETEIGLGYARLQYDQFPCQTCAKQIDSAHKNYWGVTRAGITLIYYIF